MARLILYLAVSQSLAGPVVSEEPLLISLDGLEEPVELLSGEGLLGLDHGFERVLHQVRRFWMPFKVNESAPP